MSTGNKSNMSLRQRAKTLTESVSVLEKELDNVKESQNKIVDAINKTLGSHPVRLSAVEEVLGAALDLLGLDQAAVDSRIKENRQTLAKVQYDRTQEAIAKAVQDGLMIPADSLDEGVLFFALEKTAEGIPVERDAQNQLVYEGHVEIEFSKLSDEAKNLFKGLKVGDTATTPAGSTVLIEAIYKTDPVKAQEVLKKAMEEAGQAEAPPENSETSPEPQQG